MAKASRSDVGREAVIGRATRVRGRVTGDGNLLVMGSVEGDISIQGAVTVRGELRGDVQAAGVVRIEAGSVVHGDLHGESVAIEEGAEVQGRLNAEFELPPELGGGGRRR